MLVMKRSLRASRSAFGSDILPAPDHQITPARKTVFEESAMRLTKLGTIGLCAAGRFAEHLRASGLGQFRHLCRDALPVRGYPRIAIFHALFMRLIYAAEKLCLFNTPVLLH